jgi:predicted nucleotidyltransferase
MMIGYASAFVAYALRELKVTANIRRIVLFGSVVRGEATAESDVDLFIEVKKKSAALERDVRAVEKKFYKSRDAALFKTKGVDNPLSIKIGKLQDWKGLYRSVASTGIVLFGPYEASGKPADVTHYAIIYWDSVRKNRGAFLNKLYGFTIGGKKYAGLVEKISGRKIGKSCVMVPVQYKEEIFALIKEHKAAGHVVEVFG